ncbi:MAG: amino acid-binding domain protein [Acidobacteria bacterium]|nr:amino acid-binding domain protein [Acidobacteriota bacterium]
MQSQLVMTVIGKDRTGLVESLSRLIEDNGGSWLESRMCRLGGEFAGILRVQVPEASEKNLLQGLRDLGSVGLSVTVRTSEAVSSIGPAQSATISLIGHDRPGIIHQISVALASQKINVEELESECYSAPMSGETMFAATARLRIPDSCVLADLRRELESIGSNLMVDISIKEA